MDKHNIRPVTLADAARLAEIYNYYIVNSSATLELEPIDAEEMSSRIADISTDHLYYVCENEGRIVGYAYAHPWRTRAGYKGHSLETTVYIDHEAKHQGIGSALMHHLISQCKAIGYHALIANTTDTNDASRALHEKLGYRQVAHYAEVGRKFDRWVGINSFELMLY